MLSVKRELEYFDLVDQVKTRSSVVGGWKDQLELESLVFVVVYK